MSKKENTNVSHNIKRLFLTFATFSPLVTVLFFGYPLLTHDKNWIVTNPGQSERCFAIGNFGSYINCLLDADYFLRGQSLITQLVERINSLHRFYGDLFLLSLIFVVLIIIFVIWEKES